MQNEALWTLLRDLTVVYGKTKHYILRSEQVDPKLHSNISVFKEQRDGLDHVMRALSEHLEKCEQADEKYIREQIDNARGHIFRAAYDALDSTGISFKKRINKTLDGISNETITDVYPDYWQDVLEMDKIDHQIAQHRANKDARKHTIENLDAYCESIERVSQIAENVTGQLPLLQAGEKRNRKKFRRALLLLSIVTGIIAGLVVALFLYLLH